MLLLAMSQVADEPERSASSAPGMVQRGVVRGVLMLALPVMAEQVLNMVVGLTDTWLANHLGGDPAAPTAAVGTVGYVLWLVGLIVGSVGTGSTAIIARAAGARHRSLANKVAGQSITGAVVVGVVVGAAMIILAEPIVYLTGLSPAARPYAVTYLWLLGLALPFSMTMFIANACLRGAGDTVRPALVMIVVNVTNVILSFSLTYGWGPFPALGFYGIAVGTVVAYIVGGVLSFSVLKRGSGIVRLVIGRMKPDWATIRRILRIGIPSGVEGALAWLANFGIVVVINHSDPSSVSAAAHINAIRIESISFLSGVAFATAAATLVGMNLGRNDPHRAKQSAYAAFGLGGGLMVLVGLFFVVFPELSARLLSDDPRILDLTAKCLYLAGFAQIGFAASMIFGGALRGAGDTMAAMKLNLLSVLGPRLIGVLIVGWWLNMGLETMWVVLCGELLIRGALVFGRFVHGGWRHARV